MTPTSPVEALVGGVAIGAAATGMWWGLGRVAGVSGILAGWLSPAEVRPGWRSAFLLGLVAGGLLLPTAPTPGSGPATELLAGLLVGVGARLGGGCTSGHGVCGIARGSVRSVVATATFLATGMATATLLGLARTP